MDLIKVQSVFTFHHGLGGSLLVSDLTAPQRSYRQVTNSH